MEHLVFNQYREDVSLSCFVPTSFLKGNVEELLEGEFNDFSLQERLFLVVLDRDGYFYSEVKPSPTFLSVLAKYKIYVQAFSVFNAKSKVYGCFLKTFVKNNPKFIPTNFLNKN